MLKKLQENLYHEEKDFIKEIEINFKKDEEFIENIKTYLSNVILHYHHHHHFPLFKFRKKRRK